MFRTLESSRAAQATRAFQARSRQQSQAAASLNLTSISHRCFVQPYHSQEICYLCTTLKFRSFQCVVDITLCSSVCHVTYFIMASIHLPSIWKTSSVALPRYGLVTGARTQLSQKWKCHAASARLQVNHHIVTETVHWQGLMSSDSRIIIAILLRGRPMHMNDSP